MERAIYALAVKKQITAIFILTSRVLKKEEKELE